MLKVKGVWPNLAMLHLPRQGRRTNKTWKMSVEEKFQDGGQQFQYLNSAHGDPVSFTVSLKPCRECKFQTEKTSGYSLEMRRLAFLSSDHPVRILAFLKCYLSVLQ